MSEYLEFGKRLALEAGEVMKEYLKKDMGTEVKDDSSPVTIADKKINDLVIERVKARFPDHGILAEEGSEHNDEEYTWVCDPIDGTIPYTLHIPMSTFMLALTRNGKSIMGIIHDPFAERLFTAEEGKGAFLNGKRIHVDRELGLKGSVVGMCYWKKETLLLKTHQALVAAIAKIFMVPSIGYLDVLVAEGRAAAAIFGGYNPWDSAAAAIIVTEAGGRFTDLEGNEVDFSQNVKGHLASNGTVHEELLKRIREDLKGSKSNL